MDKRWIYVIIIFIIGFTAMFYIVDTSTTVGKAVVAVNTHLVTVPSSFNIEGNEYNYALLVNRQTQEHIFIKDLGKGDLVNQSFEEEIGDIEATENVSRISYTTEKYNDKTYHVINYETSDGKYNKVLVFTQTHHTFKIKSTDFMDEKSLKENTEFVIDTFKQDYKKTQD